MSKRHIYPCINHFKLWAALLVIAIHTSPLTSISVEADFILTRIIARTAVPFFFMVTGYFILPRALKDNKIAFTYLKRIGIIYLASMILFLPVGIYAGHFKGAGPVGILKMIFLDGTFYHLWYLPALLLGFVLMLFFLRTLPMPAVAILTGILYLVGLFGDSYYGLFSEASLVHTCYDGLFHVFEYTRNGLFYTPVFLFLGWLLSSKERPSDVFSLVAVGIFSGLILAEGITLRIFDIQRHDSMYLFLLPLMYVFFSALLDGDGPDFTSRLPKELPLFIYLLHPLFILVVRAGAKITGLQIFVDNSLVHYMAVSVSTFLFCWAALFALERIRARFKS